MKAVFGGILMAVGILIAGGSGLCSLAILFGGSGEFSGFGMWPMVLMIGGIPFAVGAGIAYGGYALLRSARNEREQDFESNDPHAQ
jgi:hypothetical protein